MVRFGIYAKNVVGQNKFKMIQKLHTALFITLLFLHTKLSAGGLDGVGMADEVMKGFLWFSISLIVFFVARKQYRNNNDRGSLNLMLIALVSLFILFIYGMIGMYLSHGHRVVPGTRGFRMDPSSVSFIIQGVIAISIAVIAIKTRSNYKKNP